MMTVVTQPATVPETPLGIEIGSSGSRPFKSIDELVWDNIPRLAVLTGLNGSGKTQLLELLAHKLTNTLHPQMGHLFNEVRFVLTGDTFDPGEVAYLPNWWNVGGAQALTIAEIQQAKNNLFSQVQEINVQGNMAMRALRSRLTSLLGVVPEQLGAEEFVKRLPDDFSFMLDESNITSGLVHVFLAYRLTFVEELERGTLAAEVPSKIGPAPWDVLNETFQAAEFPYRVTNPLGSRLLDTYHLYLEDPQSGLKLRPQDLSSGEITLLGLVLWLYSSKHHGRFPRLLLLDEPDAHLHPSMTRHFLNVLKEVLVDRYNVRVILTTHSPSTVALAPDGSIFEMSRTKPRIKASKSKSDTIGLLTAGLVTVSPSTRYVLVEDEGDVEFYGAVRDILSDYGPSRDPRAIKPSPSIVFLPASVGAGKGKIGGGKSVVSQWVDKFDQAPLDQIIRGVIDRDTGNTSNARVYVLGRYSIENYLLDPFAVFDILLDQGTAPPVTGINISAGDEHRIRTLTEVELQNIVAAARAMIEPTIPGLNSAELAPQAVSFTNGKTVEYPGWMINRRGHDLLPLYQSVFGGPGIISPPRLYKSLRRVRLIPTELADIMDKLQG
jgi:ABC-type dipeptide/oligopeptide/nickel transport system ATPase component